MSTFEQRMIEARELLDMGYQCLGEHEAQYASECSMFGDAGPGQAITIKRIKKDLAVQEAEYTRLMSTLLVKHLKPNGIKKLKKNEKKYLKIILIMLIFK